MTRRLLLAAPLIVLTMFAAIPTTKLSIHVMSPGGKPLDRASVIVKFLSSTSKVNIKRTRTTWETKTDQEGFSRIPSIPQGKIQVQIIAEGYQTFGQLFDVTEDEKTLEIRLNPPQAQFSAHDK
jgi:hypothetical protein